MKSRLILFVLIFSISGLSSFRGHERMLHRRSAIASEPVGVVYIIIDKSDYELNVYDDKGWYATYPVVFGSRDMSDKMMEGDKKTPEGTFKVISKRVHEKWHKMMMLDYPTKYSWEKFKERKAEGIIPRNAKIGGGIGIHGTWPHDNIVVDAYTNWTNGCISLKNEDIDEIYEYLPVGATVIIRR